MNDISLLDLDPDQVFRLFSRHPLIRYFLVLVAEIIHLVGFLIFATRI